MLAASERQLADVCYRPKSVGTKPPADSRTTSATPATHHLGANHGGVGTDARTPAITSGHEPSTGPTTVLQSPSVPATRLSGQCFWGT